MFEKDRHSFMRKADFIETLLTDFRKQDIIMSPPWEAFLYAAGFPCTPFSVLHGDSALLGDSEAAQLFEVIRRLKLMQPVAACPNSSMLTVH